MAYTDEINKLFNENLFNEWAEYLIKLNELYNSRAIESVFWKRAKAYAIGIASSKNPRLMFEKRCSDIKYDNNNLFSHFYLDVANQTIISCVYSMLLFSSDDDVRQKIEVPKFDYYDQYSNKCTSLLHTVIDKIESRGIERDYNYDKEDCILDEDAQTKATIAEKDEQIKQLKEQLKAKQEETATIEIGTGKQKKYRNITAREAVDIVKDHNKLSVMQKQEWASLLADLLGLQETSFKNYMT